MNQQNVARKNTILSVEADRVGGVPRRVQNAHRKITNLDDLAVLDVNFDVRRRCTAMHRDWCAGQFAEFEGAAAMVGMRVRIDNQVQLQSTISEDRQVALDLVP